MYQKITSNPEHKIKASVMANSKITVAILVIFLVLTGYHVGKDIQSWSYASGERPVTHVVLFQYKKKASSEDIAEVGQPRYIRNRTLLTWLENVRPTARCWL
jgi:hypothetical protein